MVLTQKENALLQDLKNQEQVCVDKYNRYSQQACDAQLKTLFTSLGQTEQHHLDTINQMLNGTVPQMNAGQQKAQQSAAPAPTYGANASDPNKQNDAYLCQDALSTEKHVSSIYDTSIFEFKDVSSRNALNHIQKEEQEHGKRIYDYMAANAMYG